ncbi:hypothetical protein DICPUDRAFT_149515 [Dictyostelium purpureum]|uniref:EF-hand domain-containing protein n=1 Tax=Dictyostelium purpureum TaxID=5786 RepID=F0ZDY4_DICPU|nr:uncharacterized protein DICPUDRAFT_149515 [Dictyostelium purpureum]EGC37878.1 hypothetical protein DICPUDRAFT_149515 [Dictyostelium purpureum]|eukprot:XP_003285628.1 hypothetical protein DICPUDRAFT_149515 [Dictyostelium purpureum]
MTNNTTSNTTTTINNLSEDDREILAIELCEEANKLIKKLKVQEDENILEETTSSLSNTKLNSENTDNDSKEADDDEEEEFDENKTIEQITALFTKAIEIDITCLDAYLGLAYIKGIVKDYETAQQLLIKAQAIDPEDERVSLMKQTLEQDLLNDKQDKEDVDSMQDDECVLDTGKSSLNVPLIVINGKVTKKFIVILREIFDRFDLNKDNCLNKREMQLYSKAVNGQEMDPHSLQSILSHYDSNRTKGLTFTGFVELYVNQTIEDPSETIKDLNTLGYNKNLVKK